MSTLKTRFRDVPWEEIMKFHKPHPQDDPAIWEKMRGTPVEITLPAPDVRYPDQACDEPHYFEVNGDGSMVCSHLAEIGD